jgi:uncharacterized protein
MSGQKNLAEVIKSLKASCDNIEYGFAAVQNNKISIDDQVFCTVKENEGFTIIADKKYFETNGIKYDCPFAKLTIETHTSLDLIGLTAVLSKKLADNNIPANIIAGYYHDHIFVPYELRQKAIDLINN